MTPIVVPYPSESLGRGSSTAIVPGTGTSVPSGIDGIILYNELTMNNRSWYDTIVITKIDGRNAKFLCPILNFVILTGVDA